MSETTEQNKLSVLRSGIFAFKANVMQKNDGEA